MPTAAPLVKGILGAAIAVAIEKHEALFSVSLIRCRASRFLEIGTTFQESANDCAFAPVTSLSAVRPNVGI
jgi:hypothetical protein